MQPLILTSKTSSQLNKWHPYKSWPHPRDLLKSIPQMSQQQLSLNLVQINLCAYYNPDVLQMLNNKMTEKEFYLMNRHMLENLVNTYSREKGLNQKIKLIGKRFDDIYINGIIISSKNANNHKVESSKIDESKQQQTSTIDALSLSSSTVNEEVNSVDNILSVEDSTMLRAKFIKEREQFILALSNISDRVYECKQGKTAQQITINKRKIFTQLIIQLNTQISSYHKKSPPTNSFNPYTFYSHRTFHPIQQITLANSTFIPTKNRNPLKLDFGFNKFIYKNDDQLAHEIIAMEFIRYLNKIFDREYILEYQILPQVKGALYQFVQGAKTVAEIKKQFKDLLQYMRHLSQTKGIDLQVIQKRFAQSYAGYCIAQFMLEIKDRNNANLMLKDDGTFFHIDLAFIFNAKPGGISFQSAPFKMTKQYIKAMGGFDSDNFKYFQSLLIQLITRIYQSRDQYLCKLDILGARSKQIRCFSGFDIQKYKSAKIVKSLEEARLFVEDLIDKSYDSWCTKKYDTYQWKTNKIPA